MIRLYGYKKCGTCRKAEKALEKYAIEYTFIDITEAPPDVATLKKIIDRSGVELNKMFNTSGVQYRELSIKEKLPTMSTSEMLDMLAGNGRLIKRPLVFDGNKATVGFKQEEFEKIWRK